MSTRPSVDDNHSALHSAPDSARSSRSSLSVAVTAAVSAIATTASVLRARALHISTRRHSSDSARSDTAGTAGIAGKQYSHVHDIHDIHDDAYYRSHPQARWDFEKSWRQAQAVQQAAAYDTPQVLSAYFGPWSR